jgi:tetratricopeptide (TPR) repeat protein
VIDNLDDINVVNGLLPENEPEKHTLITTRNPFTTKIPAEPLEVPVLDEEESIDLLLTLSKIAAPTNPSHRREATRIVKELEYLPLAINQAAAYVREVTGEFVSYSEEYHKNRKELHKWPTGIRDYPYSIATTWSMSFKVLQDSQREAVCLLRLFSFMNPDGIFIEFLQAGAAALDDELRQMVLNITELGKALIELEKFSLIKWDRLHKSVSIHRLVQAVVVDDIGTEELPLILESIIEMFDCAFPKKLTNETRPFCRKYESQLVEPLLRLKTIRSEISRDLKRRVGIFLLEDGKYKDSEKLLLQAFEAYADTFGTDDPETFTIMNKLASTYWAQGKTTEVARLQEEVLERSKQILGEDHPDTLMTMNNLASTYWSQAKTEQATRLQDEVLEKRLRILGEDHPDVLTTMNNLAVTYWAQGETRDAVKLQEEVLEKNKRILGEDHLDTLRTMDNLALIYWSQGNMEEAARLQEEVLEKSKRILGDDHPNTLTTMNSLAVTYRAQGKTKKADGLQDEMWKKSRQAQRYS